MNINYVDTKRIAEVLGLSRTYVTDTLTKQPGFPRPVVDMSQKLRRWDWDDVARYLARRK